MPSFARVSADEAERRVIGRLGTAPYDWSGPREAR